MSEGELAVDAVLVYDGECPYCTVAARAMERARGVGAVSWYDEPAQAFLRAQFPDHEGPEPEGVPFAMFLVDPREGRVYGGRAAARELAERAGLPGPVGGAVSANYETVASLVGTLSGRGREAAPYHDTYPLGGSAREHYPAMAATAEPGRPTETA
jgi:hypothetical protein